MKKISTFLQSKTSAHVILYKMWINKNGGQSNPVGGKKIEKNEYPSRYYSN